MRSITGYAVLVLATIYVEIMYTEFYGITLLSFEFLLLLAMFLLSWYLKRMLSAGLEVKIPAAEKGEEIQVRLNLRNRGFLPVTRLRFRVAAENPYTSHSKIKMSVTESVPVRGQKSVLCQAAAEYCGRYRFYAEKGRVWDYLGMFSRRVRCGDEAYVNVLPGFYPMEIGVSERTRMFPADGDEYDARKSGDDPSEIFQIREFRDGDSLQRVHWKLSAKTDQLMTKELGLPVGYSVLLLVDFHMENGAKDRMQKMDAVFEISASLSISMQRAGVRHFVAWYDESREKIMRASVGEEEDAYEMADRLLGAEPYDRDLDLWQAYRQEYPGERFATVLRLDTQIAVSRNGESALAFEAEHPKEQILETFLEV